MKKEREKIPIELKKEYSADDRNYRKTIDGVRVVTGTLDESLTPSSMTMRHPVLVERFKSAYLQNK